MPGPNETRLNLIDGVEYITLRADDFRAEIGRLIHLHNLDHSLADQREAECERLRIEVATLEALVAKQAAELDDCGERASFPES